jgi:hypothetical protein
MPEKLPPRPPDPALVFERCGFVADPWQIEVLRSSERRLLLNCCRQAGKSTTVAFLALYRSIRDRESTTLLVSRTHRQAQELFRKVRYFFSFVRLPPPRINNRMELCLTNGSRIVALPCQDETIRGYSGVNLLVLDEAARIPDDIFFAVRPMLATSAGTIICMSTPNGPGGFFWEAATKFADVWKVITINASQVPRIPPEYLAEERRLMRPEIYEQEYECAFTAAEGQVYPDFAAAVVDALPAGIQAVKWLGGIDFGTRNPFAALWGFFDPAGIFWLCGELYERGAPLSDYFARLPRELVWTCDPSGKNERLEMKKAGFRVQAGNNAKAFGINLVTRWLRSGRLKIVRPLCPNLCSEAPRYRYAGGRDGRPESEEPVDELNHAMDALRYLFSRVPPPAPGAVPPPAPASTIVPSMSAPVPAAKKPRPWNRLDNEAVWTRIL